MAGGDVSGEAVSGQLISILTIWVMSKGDGVELKGVSEEVDATKARKAAITKEIESN